METQNIDSIIKKAINESSSFYDIEANKAKERIWREIQFQKQGHRRSSFFRLLVAACILLLISTSVISISFIKTKKSMETILEANSILEKNITSNKQHNITVNQSSRVTNSSPIDTVFIEKKVIIAKPVLITKRTADTVFIKQIVYVEKEQTPELLTSEENSIEPDSSHQKNVKNYETEILISNKDFEKHKQRKKIQIKFGGNKGQTSEGALAFTTTF